MNLQTLRRATIPHFVKDPRPRAHWEVEHISAPCRRPSSSSTEWITWPPSTRSKSPTSTAAPPRPVDLNGSYTVKPLSPLLSRRLRQALPPAKSHRVSKSLNTNHVPVLLAVNDERKGDVSRSKMPVYWVRSSGFEHATRCHYRALMNL